MSAAVHPAEDLARRYWVFARAFDDPRADVWDVLEGQGVDEWLGGADRDSEGTGPRRLQEVRESQYVNAFELGGIPLYEGLHRRDEGREGILEDLLRFYHFFGLRLSAERRDYPDHLVTELEFMGHLASREGAALESGEDPAPYRRAQQDFLDRHLLRWVPRLTERIAAGLPSSRYRELGSLLAAFVEKQRQRRGANLEGEGP